VKIKYILPEFFVGLRPGWYKPTDVAKMLGTNMLTVHRYFAQLDSSLIRVTYSKSKTGDPNKLEKSYYWPGETKYKLLFLQKECANLEALLKLKTRTKQEKTKQNQETKETPQ